jgi:hypothetical protein
MPTSLTDYGKYFAEMIETNVTSLIQSSPVRERNSNAPFAFGENYFRKHMRAFKAPEHWPELVIERRVRNDSQGLGRNGCIDYFFQSAAASSRPDISEVLATCEVGGPTRPVLLLGSTTNWYPKIVRDIKKQVGRAIQSPNTQHYLALLITPSPNLDVRSALELVFVSMLREVPQAELLDCSWAYCKGLHIAVKRVVATTVALRPAALGPANNAP